MCSHRWRAPNALLAAIGNVLITNTPINGGVGLNVLSAETFERLQAPYDQLLPTKPFAG